MNAKEFTKLEELKAKHPDALIIVEDGCDYFMYNEDADQGHDITNINIKLDAEKNRYISFKSSDIGVWLPKMIRAGKRVAIVEQQFLNI